MRALEKPRKSYSDGLGEGFGVWWFGLRISEFGGLAEEFRVLVV